MTFAEIIAFVNTRVAGWAAYYGRFCKSALYAAFRGLNVYLMRWAMRKYKSLKHSRKKAWAWLEVKRVPACGFGCGARFAGRS
jgi:RNA-directed DNA polymerase